ncbi:hypothetical protein COCSADRAFT_207849 [Bipolaris sorokiniana ND90Pr]|uniref:Uncharacterized protein n=1 Tax=Cochliobolus sativus (strain ND90Pr / ATCC 201652) TaxID=665912 RepID=M2SPT7_COCSN|nr:uncharacterized protein COCSADRAFT_207849 [Bipolaris sorokiniana ND90Pr]EMD69243.1 hypothetical protein COCSADRAFT_207849 [Bipolaris sorokiniana ND90Pr]
MDSRAARHVQFSWYLDRSRTGCRNKNEKKKWEVCGPSCPWQVVTFLFCGGVGSGIHGKGRHYTCVSVLVLGSTLRCSCLCLCATQCTPRSLAPNECDSAWWWWWWWLHTWQ